MAQKTRLIGVKVQRVMLKIIMVYHIKSTIEFPLNTTLIIITTLQIKD